MGTQDNIPGVRVSDSLKRILPGTSISNKWVLRCLATHLPVGSNCGGHLRGRRTQGFAYDKGGVEEFVSVAFRDRTCSNLRGPCDCRKPTNLQSARQHWLSPSLPRLMRSNDVRCRKSQDLAERPQNACLEFRGRKALTTEWYLFRVHWKGCVRIWAVEHFLWS